VDRSRENLGVETLDLLQLHCPPADSYYQLSVFGGLETLHEEDRIDACGVSVERVEEASKAITYPGVGPVQIIFNPLRQRPADLLFREAAARDVGAIVRVPLASGLLTGTLSGMTPSPRTITGTSTASERPSTSARRSGSFLRGRTRRGLDGHPGLFDPGVHPCQRGRKRSRPARRIDSRRRHGSIRRVRPETRPPSLVNR